MSYLKTNLLFLAIVIISDHCESVTKSDQLISKVILNICPNSSVNRDEVQSFIRFSGLDGHNISISTNVISSRCAHSVEDSVTKVKSILISAAANNETDTGGNYSRDSRNGSKSFNKDGLVMAGISSSVEALQDMYVMSDGVAKIAGDYYHPEDYCILGSTKSHMELKMCVTNSTNSTNSKSGCKNATLCVSKCCDLDEVLEFDGLNPVCRPTRRVTWHPFIYKSPYERSHSEMPKFKVIEGRMKNDMGQCERFQKLPTRNLFEIHPHWQKAYWRLLEDGSVAILNDYREWEILNTKPEFCVDGLQNVDNTGSTYHGEEDYQIILICRTSPSNLTYSDLEPDKDLLYLVLCYLSAFFYLLTTLVYLILFSTKSSNVWTVLGYVGSLLALKTLLGTCYLINYLSATNPSLEIELGTWLSWGLAVSTHFFVLSSYSWIALMSFDLMRTIRSRTLVSTKGGRFWMFLKYSLIGWGLPCIAISVFVALNNIFADPLTEVIIPEYGMQNYFISPSGQGPYIYYIITAILLVNIIFVIISMRSILSSRRNSQTFTGGELSFKSSEYISFWLLIKLFILTGSLWSLEVISWLHEGQSNPWYYVLTDFIVQLQSVWTFLILVCNTRTLKKLKAKFNNAIESTSKKIVDIFQPKFHRRASQPPSGHSVVTNA